MKTNVDEIMKYVGNPGCEMWKVFENSDDVRRYFTVENMRHMFPCEDQPTQDLLDDMADDVIDECLDGWARSAK
jgi:hypothetical protein